ncbi:hypothetical protein IWZ01DRAFT_513015 [Phyllosticta capitalensis]
MMKRASSSWSYRALGMVSLFSAFIAVPSALETQLATNKSRPVPSCQVSTYLRAIFAFSSLFRSSFRRSHLGMPLP